MSKGTQIILTLAPHELRGALVKNGTVVQSEVCSFDGDVTWLDAWDDGLRPFDQVLRQLISRLRPKRGVKTTLVYQSPSAVVQYDEIEGSRQSAEDQAEAKIRDVVGEDGCVKTKSFGHGPKNKAKCYSCLTIGDQDSTARKMYGWMTRCGLKVDRMIPAEFVKMLHAIELSLKQEAGVAVCYMGEGASVIAFAVGGRVKLVRSLEIGYRHLKDAYSSAFFAGDSEESQSAEIVEFLASGRTVEDLIWEFGMPVTADGEHVQMLRREILPRVAPVLQRYSVEIKQTFRFGLPKDDLPSRLVLCGPGAAIPHIGAALSQNCDMHIDLVQGAEMYRPMKPFGIGTIEWAFTESKSLFPSILPKVAVEHNHRRLCDRAIAAGVALAFGVMALEVGTTHVQAKSLADAIGKDEARVQAILNEQEMRLETISHADIVGQIATVFTENFGQRPRWSLAFEAVGGAMEKSIQIDQIQGDNTGGESTVELTGLVVGSEDSEPAMILEAFVKSLYRYEGIMDVRLGATAKRTMPDGKPAVQFELTMPIRTDDAPFYECTALASDDAEKVGP